MTEKRAISLGKFFQLALIGSYILQQLLFGVKVQWASVWLLPAHLGMLLFTYCLIVLYALKGREKKLITNGPFKYTRHPMYTGLFLMNTVFWLPKPVSEEGLFYLLQGIFISSLVIAAWFQEKETIARFGEKAKEYYSKTPRLFIFYPFVKAR